MLSLSLLSNYEFVSVFTSAFASKVRRVQTICFFLYVSVLAFVDTIKKHSIAGTRFSCGPQFFFCYHTPSCFHICLFAYLVRFSTFHCRLTFVVQSLSDFLFVFDTGIYLYSLFHSGSCFCLVAVVLVSSLFTRNA